MNLAILPARGGSKRIPRKNIRPFRGRPMLVWSIEAARAAGVFDAIMVSTDDDEIADVAMAAGAVVPFRRSAETSSDFATTAAVLLEVLDAYAARGVSPEFACCLYPTAPFVRGADLAEGLARLRAGGFDSFFPVSRFDYPIWRSLRRAPDGRIALNFPEHLDARSQDLPPAYHDAGQWYWFRPEALRRDRTLMGGNAGTVVLPAERVQDVDTEEDWAAAEWKHERLFG